MRAITAAPRRPARLTLAMMLVLVASAFSATPTLAASCVAAGDPAAAGQPLPGSCFEGYDGDQVDSDGSGAGNDHTDWGSVGSIATFDDDSVGSNDSQFGPGGSEETPDGWTFDFGSLASDKYDAISAWGANVSTGGPGSDVFLGLSFLRASNNGTTHLAFELNQHAPGYRTAVAAHSGSVIKVPTRSAGDVLVTYSVDPPVLGVCRWTGNEHTGHWVDFGGATVNAEACPALPAGLVQAAMNATTITGANNPLRDFSGTLDAKTFGEATLNLTRAVKLLNGIAVGDPMTCVDFDYAWLHSRSSLAITSNQQDYILPTDGVDWSTCVPASTSIAYTGQTFDNDGNGTTVLWATVTGPVFQCSNDRPVEFRVDGSLVGTANTDGTGEAYVVASLGEGIPEVVVIAPHVTNPACAPSASEGGVLVDATDPWTTAPTRSLVAGTALAGGMVPVALAWTGADTLAGIDYFDLGQRTDSGGWTTVATGLSETSTSRNLASGHKYRFRVRAVDLAGNTGPWIYGSSFTLSSRTETSSAIHYGGTWARKALASYRGGHAKVASTAGRTASQRFTGTSFAWLASKGPTMGKARISVNGTVVATVDLYAPTVGPQQLVWTRNYASSKTKTITIKVLGTPGHPRVNVDGVFVIQ